jgi:hypothetical protein
VKRRTLSLSRREFWGTGGIGPTDTMDRLSLPAVRMPNRDGFIDAHSPRKTP